MPEQVTLEDAIRQANDLRSKILSGEQIPKEELKLALNNLRAGRSSAATKKKESKKKVEPIDLGALFSTPVEEKP